MTRARHLAHRAVLPAALALSLIQPASASPAPIVVPSPLAPALNSVSVHFGGVYSNFTPNAVALSRGGSVQWVGPLDTTTPLFAAGSGISVERQFNTSLFTEAGRYDYTSNQIGLSGTVYVIGPRAVLTATAPNPDWSKPVTFVLDASGSFVTDFDPVDIVRYSFDGDGDGTFEQTGPAATETVTFPGAGLYHPIVQVTDTIGRTATAEDPVNIPKPASPEPDGPGSTADAGTSTPKAVKPSRRLVVTASSRASRRKLRRPGYLVRVRGTVASDRVVATITVRKKRLTRRTSAGDGVRLARSIRLRFPRAATAYLSRHKTRSVRLLVTVTGKDGFQATKRKTVRIKP